MLGGDTCTRHCGFCAVNKGKPLDLDPMEPTHVTEAVKNLGLAHAVITSVNRDDLPGVPGNIFDSNNRLNLYSFADYTAVG